MPKPRYKLLDGGKILDTVTNEIVAVDSSVGLSEHSFKDLESVGVFSWNQASQSLLDMLTEEYDPTAHTVSALAKKTGLSQKEVKDTITHPAFVWRLQTYLQKEYDYLTTLRHRQMSRTLNKLLERLDLLFSKTDLSLQEQKELATLTREIRAFRETERTEHGEVTAIIESRQRTTGDDLSKSIVEFIRKHPEQSAAIALSIIQQQDGAKAPVEIVDAEEVPIPPEPPARDDSLEFPKELGSEEVTIHKTGEEGKPALPQPPSVFQVITKMTPTQ